VPHALAAQERHCAGTYYSEATKEWRTFDHVFVSGGLLGSEPPYLDEATLRIGTEASSLTDGKPMKFKGSNGIYQGVSDHYPIRFRIVLEAPS
jgi:hypothetical protein